VLTQCSGQLDIASQPGTGTTVTVRLHHRIAEQEST
jgi:signal transduction histidine kinase